MSDRSRPRADLRLEPLDARLAPVVGAFAEAPATAAGSVFDGVVQVHVADGVGSGALLYTGHDWVEPAIARRSMELMAREVMPRVNAALIRGQVHNCFSR